MAEQSRPTRDGTIRRQRSNHASGASTASGAAGGTERTGGDEDPPAPPDPTGRRSGESDAERRLRRVAFLYELAEARALRARVQPRRTKERRMREAARMRTFRG